jgi:hypothetical protein
VLENSLGNDERDHPHAPATAGAAQHVELEHAMKKGCPIKPPVEI